ncbi:MAG: VOC family protein [Myxococcota bacterium]
MSRVDTYSEGTFCWVDLSTPDYDGAVEFYQKLFGWSHQEGPSADGHAGRYGFFQIDGVEVAGIGEIPPSMRGQMPPVWNNYVAVGDTDSVVDKAKTLGAKVMFDPMDTPGGNGRLAYLTDPTGATVALWQGKAHRGAGIVNEPVALCWNELQTRDLEAAKSFYGELFGWTFSPMPGPSSAVGIKNRGRDNGHILTMTEAFEGIPPAWTPYFAVADADQIVTEVETLGGTVPVPPQDIPPGRFAVVSDPQGGHFYVIALARASE